MRTAFRLLGVGWFVSFCILGGVAGGHVLDDRFGTAPAITLLGLGLGIAGAGGGVYQMLVKAITKDKGSAS